MAGAGSGLLASVQRALSQVPLNPLRVTGPLASKDWHSADLPVEQYRLQTPGTPRQTPMVPHAEPDEVYDIKYFTRDAKRSDIKVGGTDQLRHVTYTYSLEALAAEVAGDLQGGGARRAAGGLHLPYVAGRAGGAPRHPQRRV